MNAIKARDICIKYLESMSLDDGDIDFIDAFIDRDFVEYILELIVKHGK